MTTDVAKAPTEREVLVMTLGAAGRGRAEIALALGVSLPLLEVEAAEDTRLDALLRAADGLALAWWETQTREACEAGRFDLAGWGREMQRRFGETRPRADGAPPAPRSRRAALAAQPVTTIYQLPCNRKDRLSPDGTCPCDACRDKRLRRAERKAWRVESLKNAARPAPDEIDPADDHDEEINDEQL